MEWLFEHLRHRNAIAQCELHTLGWRHGGEQFVRQPSNLAKLHRKHGLRAAPYHRHELQLRWLG